MRLQRCTFFLSDSMRLRMRSAFSHAVLTRPGNCTRKPFRLKSRWNMSVATTESISMTQATPIEDRWDLPMNRASTPNITAEYSATPDQTYTQFVPNRVLSCEQVRTTPISCGRQFRLYNA